MNFIQGSKFIQIADWVYSPARGSVQNKYRNDINNLPEKDYRYLKNTFDINQLKDRDIIYTHSFYAEQLFEELIKTDKNVILITHNCDLNIEFSPPDNVLKWYSQNINILHPRIESIPIGLENDYWLPGIKKKEKMILKGSGNCSYRNLVYMNHNIKTNPTKRLKPYQLFRNKSWVTVENRENGQGFDQYIDNVFNHRFMICPEGNGMDTHRTWECLYLGTIPIEKRNINNTNFEKLFPILLVDDWDEVTEDLLTTKWRELAVMDYAERLDFNYWKNKINET
jgi:hypothetical protein